MLNQGSTRYETPLKKINRIKSLSNNPALIILRIYRSQPTVKYKTKKTPLKRCFFV